MTADSYDIALSFAGEDRAYVEMVADQLRGRSVSVFYDRYNEADLWGKDLYTHLIEVYRQRAKYTLMFISKHYREKMWANHERRAAQSRAFEDAADYILPARFDDTEIPGLLPTTAYIDLRLKSPAEVALLVCIKLGREPDKEKAHWIASPRNPASHGEVAFNFRSYNGRFRIGESKFEFETLWSRSGNDSIHCYTDTPTIRAIATLPTSVPLQELKDTANLDFTSRTRTPRVGQVVVLQNTSGFFAALRITSIGNTVENDDENELRFKYWILTDGSSDFSSAKEA